jgi:hypothetical protein
MKDATRDVVPIGDLVAAVFDTAEQYSADPRVVSRLATDVLDHMLRRAPGPRPGLPRPARLVALQG